MAPPSASADDKLNLLTQPSAIAAPPATKRDKPPQPTPDHKTSDDPVQDMVRVARASCRLLRAEQLIKRRRSRSTSPPRAEEALPVCATPSPTKVRAPFCRVCPASLLRCAMGL
jgi:hypothetical protein